LRGAARGLLSWIDGLFPGGDPGAVKLREGHGDTVELSRRSPSYRSADADDEILDVADHVLHFAGGAKVMTANSASWVSTSLPRRALARLADHWAPKIGTLLVGGPGNESLASPLPVVPAGTASDALAGSPAPAGGRKWITS
jgi:hypothetical protein